MNRRNVALVYPNNPRRNYPLVDDKVVCKELLNKAQVPTSKTIAVCAGLFDVDRVVRVLLDRGDFVVKPASGSGGSGILVIRDPVEDGWLTTSGRFISTLDLRNHIANCVFGAFSNALEDRALVEERICPHEFFDHMTTSGVSDVRIITLAGRPLLAMLRVPTTKSDGKANLHQGGIGIGVDIETGETTRAQMHGRECQRHPETGAELVGLSVPDWDKVLSIAAQAAAAVPLGYLGVDLIIDQSLGPLVIELNARPGLEIQNVNHTPLGPQIGADK
ncbi:MAG: alpha-L-glutamate ligase-like protein [Bradymonadia bacterium]|jgi:alpha-L-glutamate ligase-like protein